MNPHHHQPDHRRQLSNEAAPEDNKGPDRVSEHLHMYLHMHSSSSVAAAPREQQIQPLAIQGAGEESATVEPQSRVSDRSRSPKRKSTGTKSTETEGKENHGGSEEVE